MAGIRLVVSVSGGPTYSGSKLYGANWVSHVEVLLAELCSVSVWLNGRSADEPPNDTFDLPEGGLRARRVAPKREFEVSPQFEVPPQFEEYPWMVLKLRNRRSVPATSTQGRRLANGPVVHQIGIVPAGQESASTQPILQLMTNTVHLKVVFGDSVTFVGQGGPYVSPVTRVDPIDCTDSGGTATVHLVSGAQMTVTLAPSP